MNNIPKNIIEPYFNIKASYENISINNSMSSIYKIWKDDILKDKLSSLLKTIYAVDVIYSINNLILEKEWSIVSYNNKETKFWDAKNPILSEGQISNPINLNKNIIVTGPNAGGKTTYVKTILSNVILGQTLGVSYSVKSKMILYDTVSSFMRVSDVLGNRSYFEAEAEYCLNMIKRAKEINTNNKTGLFLVRRDKI
jgi:DNA mismatch repair ATPase MutS